MHIPEGLKLVPFEPTKEMLKEAKRAITGPAGAVLRSQEEIFTAQYQLALAAAPTLPASEPEFFDGCDHEGFPGGCERFGHTIETCPSKPAQEDEPIYLVFSYNTYYDGSWEFANKDEFDKADEDDKYKLYTRPDNDKLRKAAEELLDALPVEYNKIEEVINLHKALEETNE